MVRLRDTCRMPLEIGYLIAAIITLVLLVVAASYILPIVTSNMDWVFRIGICLLFFGTGWFLEHFTNLSAHQAHEVVTSGSSNDTYDFRSLRLGLLWGAGIIIVYLKYYFSHLVDGPIEGYFGNIPIYSTVFSETAGITVTYAITWVVILIICATAGWVFSWGKRCLIFGEAPQNPPEANQ